jgi:hypothetical protein
VITIEQIKELAEAPSPSLLKLFEVDPASDPSPDETLELSPRKIRLSGEFWTGRHEYRVTWPQGVQARKEYGFVEADVKKSPSEISPAFRDFVVCIIASGVVTKAIALLYHHPGRETSEALVATIASIGTACFVSNPITPAEFTENIIKSSISTRWGSWG